MSLEDDNGYPAAPADKQKAVNDMAVAIAAAEMHAERMMVEVGKLPAAVSKFRKGCGLHAMKTGDVQSTIGAAVEKFGDGYHMLVIAHGQLSDILERCNLPQPGPVPTGGGGGRK